MQDYGSSGGAPFRGDRTLSKRMSAFLSRILVLAGVLATPVGAQPAATEVPQPVVVELYTSQGCSSCPPADALFDQLVARDDVIALALHVDYWDYIGWRDTFGDRAYADRQRSYARAAGDPMIYTPQMVVNGVTGIVGTDSASLADLLQREAAQVGPALDLQRKGDVVTIRAAGPIDLPAPVRVELVRYRALETVDIRGGELAGQRIAYSNIVTGWQTLGLWDGAGALSVDAKVEGPDPVVVLLQQDGPGRILAAARLK